jgi:hypothetical protein
MTYTIYGQRYYKYDPIVDNKTKEVLDDGEPKRIMLGRWSEKKIADDMADNIKANTGKRQWKIWVESS